MDDIFVYLIDLPKNIMEAIVPCADGYTVYIDCKLSREQQEKAYRHALKHIKNNDFERFDVQEIECLAHIGKTL